MRKNMSNKPLEPAKPTGMDIVFYYTCPYCRNELPIVAPFQPSMIACGVCRQKFPIVPVSEHSVTFVKIMLGEGPAAIDPDFL